MDAREQIQSLEDQTSAVVLLRELLARAKRGEIRHIAVAFESTTGSDEHATCASSLKKPGDRLRMIGLLHMALDRLTKAW